MVPHLDGFPVQFIGKGEQNTLKILLALNRGLERANIVLVEEPENHLSFSTLNTLISRVADRCEDKQVIITTHSSYVLNKLGLDGLILLNRDSVARIQDLPRDTEDYFRKLSGYDTLRLVLAKKAILVEGPSDELIVQRAYMDTHDGRLPIHDGIDVINVRGLSAKRFLDIAIQLQRQCMVVTDNDGKSAADVEAGFAPYTDHSFITVHVGKGAPKTLEPQLLAANDLATLNAVLETSYPSDDELLTFMENNKTSCAVRIFSSDQPINMPGYIADAVEL